MERTRINYVRISSVGRKMFDCRAGGRLGSIPGAGPIPRVLKEVMALYKLQKARLSLALGLTRINVVPFPVN